MLMAFFEIRSDMPGWFKREVESGVNHIYTIVSNYRVNYITNTILQCASNNTECLSETVH